MVRGSIRETICVPSLWGSRRRPPSFKLASTDPNQTRNQDSQQVRGAKSGRAAIRVALEFESCCSLMSSCSMWAFTVVSFRFGVGVRFATQSGVRHRSGPADVVHCAYMCGSSYAVTGCGPWCCTSDSQHHCWLVSRIQCFFALLGFLAEESPT